jgi:hypothetical protein
MGFKPIAIGLDYFVSSVVFLTRPMPDVKKIMLMIPTTIMVVTAPDLLMIITPVYISPIIPRMDNTAPKVRFMFMVVSFLKVDDNDTAVYQHDDTQYG